MPMQDLIKRLLAEIGEDPEREGLANTPRRVEQSLKFPREIAPTPA